MENTENIPCVINFGAQCPFASNSSFKYEADLILFSGVREMEL